MDLWGIFIDRSIFIMLIVAGLVLYTLVYGCPRIAKKSAIRKCPTFRGPFSGGYIPDTTRS